MISDAVLGFLVLRVKSKIGTSAHAKTLVAETAGRPCGST